MWDKKGRRGRWMNGWMDGPIGQQGKLYVSQPPERISVINGPSIPDENNA